MQEMSKSVFWENKKNISKCLLKFLLTVLSIKEL